MLTLIALFLIKHKYQRVIDNAPKPNFRIPQTITKPTSSLATNYPLPPTHFLPIPFTSQAPTANWDELHNEACEEASAIMASEYFSSFLSSPGEPALSADRRRIQERSYQNNTDNTLLDPKFVEQEITKLTDWQQKTFGYHLSISTEETAQMIKEVYGLSTEIKTDYTETDLKQALVDRKLILFPANGRLLNNPYYKRTGPLYHMLVIKGYDSKGNFITNDPGTKRGFNYPYTFHTLYEANGNYNHLTHAVALSKKNILIIPKPQ